jgi:hypothetical protein
MLRRIAECAVGIASILLPFVSTVAAIAQVDAPGAFSDFAGCSHHTCTWVPWSVQRDFQEGDLIYTVDLNGKGDTGGDFVLRRGDKELLRTTLKDLSASTSVVWSDDDKDFAITWSDGGEVGGFHVRVFSVESDYVTELPGAKKAFQAFKARHWCKARGDNVQAYGWLPNSHDLVLALSVYPTSDCGMDMGHMEAYVVGAGTGTIRQHWTLKQLDSYMRAHREM